jgi:hypothetical protein
LASLVVKDIEVEIEPIYPSHQPAAKRKVSPVQRAEGGGARPSLEETIVLLESKLAKAKERQTAISRERRTVSLAAHMGSPSDRACLDELNQEGAILCGEIESIEAAIADVRAKIADAEAAVAAQADREKRRAVVQLCDEACALAANIDEFWRASITNTSCCRTSSKR